jgi:hypothetical protein
MRSVMMREPGARVRFLLGVCSLFSHFHAPPLLATIWRNSLLADRNRFIPSGARIQAGKVIAS